ncbi:hypothetical protein [Azospirillum griseum]|uniref:Uncharacterized protein n=1 Tax=Azospirillum griseum TaxID=2496639 RepID=A0A431VE70_9PROT|nr:hypothetical protein [Azospirillum griseum]RTR17816.1 hypothetical protein EJ903_16915 [Azospirillum griseum]
MRELRCLVFTEQEVVKAILDRRRRVNEPLPTGTVDKVTYEDGDNVETKLAITHDDGTRETLTLPETEVAAALVAHCMNRRIPLPVASDKMLYIINGALTLMITMNFNKSPRLVVTHAATVEGAGGSSGPELRPAPRRRRIGG